MDTSGPFCAAALTRGDDTLDLAIEPMTRGQSERLFPLFADLLNRTGHDWSGLGTIVVCTGPGNFTGLRIGVAAARGLALSLNCPCIGVSQLEVLGKYADGQVFAAIPGAGGQSYVQTFLNGSPDSDPTSCSTEVLSPPIGSTIVGKQSAQIASSANHVRLVPNWPNPEALARIAIQRNEQTQAPPRPLYIRAPAAAVSRDVAPPLLPDIPA